MEEINNHVDVNEIESLASALTRFIQLAPTQLEQKEFNVHVRLASESLIDLNQILYKLDNGYDISNDDLESLAAIKSFWHELNSQNSGCRKFFLNLKNFLLEK